MEFQSQEERTAAVKKATEELGQTYGELKFKEYLLTEARQSFVSLGAKTLAAKQVIETVVEAKPVVKDKPTVKKSQAKVVQVVAEEVVAEEVVAEEVVAEEVVAEEVVVEEVVVEEVVVEEVVAESSVCPITTAAELRNLMLQKFNDSGRDSKVQLKLKAVLKDATGRDQVMQVTAEEIPAGYAAIMAVEV